MPTSTSYYGKVCIEHPELGGARNKSRKCVQCSRNHIKRLSTPEKGATKRARAKQQLLNAYGCKCILCGNTDPEVLTLDHIRGGGTAHRRTDGNHAAAIAKRMGYPQNVFRLLCFNCNFKAWLYRLRTGGILDTKVTYAVDPD